MAGIAGLFNIDIPHDTLHDREAEAVERMIATLGHRGPQKTHIIRGRNFVIGCCQPLGVSRHSQAWAGGDKEGAVFDGVLYNEEHRRYMRDDEMFWDMLFHTYRNHCFSHIDGPFAAAVANDEELLLARDHMGCRPLFYGIDAGRIAFASEAKALIPLVKKVNELSPGMVCSSHHGVQPFEPFHPSVPVVKNAGHAKKVLRELLFDAVSLQLKEQEVGGISLSGGLDSSVVACCALQVEPDLELFTVGLRGSPDIENARTVARYLGAEKRHHVYEITEKEIEEMIRTAIWHLESYDEDCVGGCIATMFASRLAAQYTSCCLSGEGADELFGGYQVLTRADTSHRQELMDRLISRAYSTGLRRLDRGWLSHSVQYRTPFLDSRVVAFGKNLPIEWKIHGTRHPGKWILREAFRDRLPAAVIDRTEDTVGTGSSVDTVLDRIISRHISSREMEASPRTAQGAPIRSARELFYYRIFRDSFPAAFESQVVRWAPSEEEVHAVSRG